MSYDITLTKTCDCCGHVRVAAFEDGDPLIVTDRHSTYYTADFSPTWNFAKAWTKVFVTYPGSDEEVGFHIRQLNGKNGADTVDALEKVVAQLGTTQDPDGWAATDGNAGMMANIMLSFAKRFPDYIWSAE